MEKELAAAKNLKYDPPKIIFSPEPAVLLSYDVEPQLRKTKNSDMMRVINTLDSLADDPEMTPVKDELLKIYPDADEIIFLYVHIWSRGIGESYDYDEIYEPLIDEKLKDPLFLEQFVDILATDALKYFMTRKEDLYGKVLSEISKYHDRNLTRCGFNIEDSHAIKNLRDDLTEEKYNKMEEKYMENIEKKLRGELEHPFRLTPPPFKEFSKEKSS